MARNAGQSAKRIAGVEFTKIYVEDLCTRYSHYAGQEKMNKIHRL